MADNKQQPAPSVAIIMGSNSDWPTMRHAAETLEGLGVSHEARIVSAHRTPERMFEFAKGARDAGFKVIIAGAGGAAHLPGMVSSLTALPVFGVPIESHALRGRDSLLSIVQMPAGIPVASGAIGKAGAKNAAYLAAQMIATGDAELHQRMRADRDAMSNTDRTRPPLSIAGAVSGIARTPVTPPLIAASRMTGVSLMLDSS